MLTRKFNPFPELHTPRLILRKINEADAPAVHRLCADKAVTKYLPTIELKTVEGYVEWINHVNNQAADNLLIDYGIVLKSNPDELLGTICLWNLDDAASRAEVGYKLISTKHGQGLMSEAIEAIMTFGKGQIGVKTFEAFTMPNNTPSLKLLAKYGFIRDLDAEARVGEEALAGNVMLTLAVEEK